MSKWNSRKKYQIEESKEEKQPKIKMTKMFQRQMYLTVLTVIGVTLVVLGNSYAVFTSLNESKGYNTIQVGTLQIAYSDSEDGLGNNLRLNNAYPISDAEGLAETPYRFTITNTGSLAADYSVRILDDEAMIEADGCADKLLNKNNIKMTVNGSDPFLLSTLEGTTPTYTIDTGTLQPGERKEFEIKMWIKSDAGNDILGTHYHGKVVIEGVRGELPNSNILAIYQYDATNCITGEESTCVELTTPPTTYTLGTIIKYKVNSTEEKYFHVISDNEKTLTLQQIESTVSGAWYSEEEDNTKGPMTILPLLESATASWTNVKDQTYTMGTTPFNNNSFTGCYETETNELVCTTNTYTLPERTAKARMITMQELTSLGCSKVEGSCPAWLATGWTMSANSAYASGAWLVTEVPGVGPVIGFAFADGGTGCSNTVTSNAHAVVEIDK